MKTSMLESSVMKSECRVGFNFIVHPRFGCLGIGGGGGGGGGIYLQT